MDSRNPRKKPPWYTQSYPDDANHQDGTASVVKTEPELPVRVKAEPSSDDERITVPSIKDEHVAGVKIEDKVEPGEIAKSSVVDYFRYDTILHTPLDEDTAPHVETEQAAATPRVSQDSDAAETWKQAGKPKCSQCHKRHPPPCDPAVRARNQARREAARRSAVAGQVPTSTQTSQTPSSDKTRKRKREPEVEDRTEGESEAPLNNLPHTVQAAEPVTYNHQPLIHPTYNYQPLIPTYPAHYYQPMVSPYPAYNHQTMVPPYPVYNYQPMAPAYPVYNHQPMAPPYPAYNYQPTTPINQGGWNFPFQGGAAHPVPFSPYPAQNTYDEPIRHVTPSVVDSWGWRHTQMPQPPPAPLPSAPASPAPSSSAPLSPVKSRRRRRKRNGKIGQAESLRDAQHKQG